jgi:DNA modification methylase
LNKFNFSQTDLWALSNTKNDNHSPSFLLCFKKSENKPKYNVKLYVSDFINKCRTNFTDNNYSCPEIIQGFSSIREPEYLKHGATFPQTLIEFFIRKFTKKEGMVLDIFAGVGLSLFAAERLQRNAIGVELNPKYVKWAKRVRKRKFGDLMNYISKETADHSEIRFINDDNRNLLVHVKKNSIDLMITSPPYFNILHKVADEAERRGTKSVFRRRKNNIERSFHSLDEYFETNSALKKQLTNTDKTAEQILSSSLIPHPYSGDDKDLGNITSYEEFLAEINQNHKRVFQVLKPGGFAIWIIRDFRDMMNRKPYINFHSDLATLAIQIGFTYYDLIVWNQNRERRLIHLGGGNTYYNSMTMSFIILLRKPLTNQE